ncbi:MAG: ABC transporter permease [Mogibacterium sp.]|nr:ABC transporter permease [Mogibacterium sp.]
MKAYKHRAVRNPLRARVLRELRGEWKKYAVIFVFLTLMIGFVSGMYVANNSMLIAADNIKSEEKREDGHFILRDKADKELKKDIETGDKADVRAYYVYDAYKDITTEEIRDAYRSEDYRGSLEKLYRDADRRAAENYERETGDFELDDPDFYAVPVTIYENFRKNADEDIDGDGKRDSGIRVYINRENINLYCLMDGEDADSEDEIVIDRMHADNRGIKTGDTITVNGAEFRVSGLAAFSNYSTLHEKSTDMMFDALTFDVAMTTREGWDRIDTEPEYEYAWLYDKKPVDVKAQKRMVDNFLKALITQAAADDNEIDDYVPEYANQAIQFAPEDFGSDKVMGGVLLNVLIVVLAFIFAITISNMISREAPVIGTLRASGYSRGELTVHYMTAPVLVTLLGALTGNILGYTYFKNTVVAMYYNSYSLPLYETVWTRDAFIKTTVIPVILMFTINLLIISRKLRFTPLRFLRNDLKSARRKRALRLPPLPFLHRFRLRIFLQNLSGYLVLAVGIGFVMLMLAMAVGMPDTLKWYQDHAAEMMLSEYETILTSDHDDDGKAIETDAEGAEKFSMEELVAVSGESEQSVNTYGIEPGSRYAKIPDDMRRGEVYVSSAYSGKFGTEAGDRIELSEKYGYNSYEFTVAGILEYDGGVAVFMDNDAFNSVFEREAESFDGFFSDTEITDIDDDYVAAVITSEDILKMAAQLDHSMGAYMLYFQYLCILLSAVLIFLLTKVILERSENSISMVKILGYSNGEIASLYIVTTTVVVILAEIVTAFASREAMSQIWNGMMNRMEGYFPFVLTQAGMLRMIALVFAGYLIVMLIDFRRIRRIPMDEALKHAE